MEVGLAIVFVVLLAVCVALSYCWQAEYDKTQKLTKTIDDSLREITAVAITDSLRKTLPEMVLALQARLTDAVARIGKQDSKIASLESQHNEQVGIIQKLERLNADKTIYGDRLHAQTVELRNELAEAKVRADRFETGFASLRKDCDALLDKANAEINDRDTKIAKLGKEIETLKLQNSGLLEAIEDRDEESEEIRSNLERQAKNILDIVSARESKIAELLNEIDRLKGEIKSNLESKRPKPWKNFLSNLIETK